MASQPHDRRKEEAALALLLLTGRRRYDLPAIIRQQGIRARPFRQIRPTLALKANMAAPHFAVTNAWAGEVDGLTAAYGQGVTAAQQQITVSASRVGMAVSAAQAQVAGIVAGVERWHRGQWLSRIKASTGLDVAMLTRPEDVADDTQAATAWNRALADDVHQQTKGRVTSIVLAGLAASSPVADVLALIRGAMARARTRAAGIGDDQTDKLSRAMDRSRRAAAGFTTYRWHHTDQLRPRPHHLARNGKAFEADDIDPADRAGVPPFCKCWEEPLFS